MKITIKTIVNSVNSGAILRFTSDSGLSAATKFRLKNVWKQIKEQFEEYDRQRIELCKKYGKLTPAPTKENPQNEVYFMGARQPEFDYELRAMQAVEVEIIGEPFLPVDLERKFDTIPDPLTPNDYLELDWLIFETAPSDASDISESELQKTE